LSERWHISGNTYWRQLRVSTFNGDAEFDDADDEYRAENRRTATDQTTHGVAAQLAYDGESAKIHHLFAVGATFDSGRADFSQYEQAADFTTDRGTEGEGDFNLDTSVHGGNAATGVFLTDTFAIGARTHFTIAGRYNHATINIEDRSTVEPELDGSHTFNRFTQSLGVTHAVTPTLTAYAGYNEGFRVPTPVELTCADPNDPCSLPVGFVADPPLAAVIAKTTELGLRGTWLQFMHWNTSAYRSKISNDILFTALQGSRGFFANVPSTRRQGFELGVSSDLQPLTWALQYSYVDATFESDVSLFNPVANPADPAQAETIHVNTGDRLPGIPHHLIKLIFDWQLVSALSVGAQLQYGSSQFLRGDENNSRRPLPGYTVAGLRASYKVTGAFRLYARMDNVFDKQYSTLGAYNRNAFDVNNAPGPGPVERFVSPGAPRSLWVGISYGVKAE
jgi:outer membrane receptor protein involved in Fe transport